jgi:hypothetical protein
MTDNCFSLLFSFLIGSLFFAFSRGSECTQACDEKYPTGIAVTFCGIDKVTYRSTFDAVDSDTCYLLCGVTALHEGECGCPNECNTVSFQGSCESSETTSTGSSCVCSSGWSGYDCSLPTKGNGCGYHGTLITPDSKDAPFPFDTCRCDAGWTGVDCTTRELSIGAAPWGTIFDDVQPYSSEDKYGDNHPLFNINVLHTIRIKMAESDFISLLEPANLWNSSYVAADLYYDNGKDQITLKDIGMKIKGTGSRQAQKKNFALKFNEFVSGQSLYDMKKVGLKPGYDSDDDFVKNMFYSDLFRSIGGPAIRQSYGLLFVNDAFYGFTIIQEDINDDFIVRRFEGDDGQGTFFKMTWNAHLGYFGDDLSYYQTKNKTTDLGGVIFYYQPELNTSEAWTDLVSFLSFYNTTLGKSFDENGDELLDLTSFLRFLVVENFWLGGDSLVNGNNYILYHKKTTSGMKMNHWTIFYCDYDDTFLFEPYASNSPDEAPGGDIFSFYNDVRQPEQRDYEDYDAIVDSIFSSAKWTNRFIDTYRDFMDGLFNSKNVQSPYERLSAYISFISPWVARDKMWQFSNGMTMEVYYAMTSQTLQHLIWRYQDVYRQLDNYALAMNNKKKHTKII